MEKVGRQAHPLRHLPRESVLLIRLRQDYSVIFKGYAGDLIYIDAFAGAGRSKISTAWIDADEGDIQLINDEFMRSPTCFLQRYDPVRIGETTSVSPPP